MKQEFGQWLEQQDYQAKTIATKVARVHRIEAWQGDLDDHYASDRLASLIETLSYSKADALDHRSTPSEMPIDPSVRRICARWERVDRFCERLPTPAEGQAASGA